MTDGRSEMIWAHPIRCSFTIFRPNIIQLLAQHILLLGYISLPSPWVLPDGLTEPFL